MRGYFLLAALLAAILLLVPLAALPKAAGKPNAVPPEESTSTPAEEADEGGGFRILVDGEVVSLPEREFLLRTLAFEMPPSYHSEALKAQAVAAFTYYGRQRQRARATPDPAMKGADFVTPAPQFPAQYDEKSLRERWGENYDAYRKRLEAAVDEVLGQYLTYGGEWIDACYFALSCGNTEDAETVWGTAVPYLRSVASPGDRLSPQFETAVSFTAAEMKAALEKAFPKAALGDSPADWLKSPVRSAAGTVATVFVGDTSVRGTALRQALSLRSTSFTFSVDDSGFHFTVHGYGHGVGMSQYGADYLARQGYNYEEILSYYYTGTTLEKPKNP